MKMLLSATLLTLAATANAAAGFCTPTQYTCMIQSDPIVTTFVGPGSYYEMTAPGTYFAFQSTEMTVQIVVGSHWSANLGRNVLVTDQLTYTCGTQAPITYTTANVPPTLQLNCKACPVGVDCLVTIGQGLDPVPNLQIQQILYNRGTNGLGGLCYNGDSACPNSPTAGGGAVTLPGANVPCATAGGCGAVTLPGANVPCATAGGCGAVTLPGANLPCVGNQCGNSGGSSGAVTLPGACTGAQCGTTKPAGPAGNLPGGSYVPPSVYAPVTTPALVKPNTLPAPIITTPPVIVLPAVTTPYAPPPAANTGAGYVAPPAGITPAVTLPAALLPVVTPAATPAKTLPAAYLPGQTGGGNILQNDALRTVSLNVVFIAVLAIFV
ncbi:hypothetical protein HDU98_003625 [Podochytrium sp. JEL0797]|nr:hypothetical protein HDU98_003625 [Podochytrium sp. JEL0797]